jgi:hypothetical protein
MKLNEIMDASSAIDIHQEFAVVKAFRATILGTSRDYATYPLPKGTVVKVTSIHNGYVRFSTGDEYTLTMTENAFRKHMMKRAEYSRQWMKDLNEQHTYKPQQQLAVIGEFSATPIKNIFKKWHPSNRQNPGIRVFSKDTHDFQWNIMFVKQEGDKVYFDSGTWRWMADAAQFYSCTKDMKMWRGTNFLNDLSDEE